MMQACTVYTWTTNKKRSHVRIGVNFQAYRLFYRLCPPPLIKLIGFQACPITWCMQHLTRSCFLWCTVTMTWLQMTLGLFMHCMNSSLNLSFQYAMSYIPHCRDAMNLIKDFINFVRDSPKRLAWFATFQHHDTGALRPLCPTGWTMRVSAVKSILDNYSELLALLQDVSDTDRSDAGYIASGFLKQPPTF